MGERTNAETRNILAGHAKSGNPVYENLPVEHMGGDRYLLLASPGLVLGVARGDVINIDASGRASVIARGGNLCIQVFLANSLNDPGYFENEIDRRLGGSMDGLTDKQVVFSVPVSFGFGKIEAEIIDLIEKMPGAEWHFGNVYDEVDGVTPLNWW